jgi:hypothetical protein
MGLSICIGVLADLGEDDPESAEYFERGMAAANRLLEEAGHPPHVESREAPPPGRSDLDGFPYSFIHYLRRAYAHNVAEPGWRATPLPEGADPTDDEVLQAEGETFSSHLICHSDAEGYYVPVDFPDVLFAPEGEEDLPGFMLGSSQRLLGELVAVAPALGITLLNGQLGDAEAARINQLAEQEDGLSRELIAWIALYEAARLSIAHRTAIVFS